MTWRQLLWPFSLLFGALTSLRNIAFDKGWLRSTSFDVPVIAVGNLSTGGTGKTPFVEFLIKNMGDKKLGFVSRGYGRKTQGLVPITAKLTPADIGDEPFQIFRKFPHLRAAVSEKRVDGINSVNQKSNLDLILLDDAYQHRHVKPHLNILLTTFQEPFYQDWLLPAGNLRESRSGKHRADIIIVTKCPTDLSERQKREIRSRINPAENQKVFFSGLQYQTPVNQRGEELSSNCDAHVLTGIANSAPMLAHLREIFKINKHWKYGDHYDFRERDLGKIRNSKIPIITTEKDWVRLIPKLTEVELACVYYLPLEVVILFDEREKLLSWIKEKL